MCYLNNKMPAKDAISPHARGLVMAASYISLSRVYVTMRTLSYRITLRKEPEGGYTVLVPSLPGCVTYGKTVEEAIDMARDAITAISRASLKTAKRYPWRRSSSSAG